MADHRDTGMRLFVYGTLLDEELRRLVIGRDVALAAATLPGWRRLAVIGAPFPMIERDPAGSVAGAVTEPLGAREMARLRHYEGDGYELVAADIRDARGAGSAAQVFVPRAGRYVGAGAWDLAAWQRDHRAATLDRLSAYRWPPG
jgi:gamma-glutamylcyclotransferase (GGCT)/AIG2-like uncharacterized protein YtfP